MKKFIAGVFVGHIVTSLATAYELGYFHRVKEFIQWEKAYGKDDQLNFAEMLAYMMKSERPSWVPLESSISWPDLAESTQVWFQRVLRMRAMDHEGYSHPEISEMMGVPEETVTRLLDQLEKTLEEMDK